MPVDPVDSRVGTPGGFKLLGQTEIRLVQPRRTSTRRGGPRTTARGTSPCRRWPRRAAAPAAPWRRAVQVEFELANSETSFFT
jgi:hypothetical protein